MFMNFFCDYDIICLQELWQIATNDLQEVLISLAQKAGFFYHTNSLDACPLFGSAFAVGSGLIILSRFPIVEQDFQPFSLIYGKNE